jgi:hypothetical protein
MQQVAANSAGLLLGVFGPLAADIDALIEP